MAETPRYPGIQTQAAPDRLPELGVRALEEIAQELGIDVSQIKRGPGALPGEYGSDEGQTFWNRAQASFKSTPKERMAFWKEKLGPENVAASEDGELLWKHPKKGWQSIDESGFAMADIADFAGDIPEIIGMVASSRLPGTSALLKGGTGAYAGNVVKQGVEQALPGESELSGMEAATSTVLGGVSEKVGRVVAPFISGSPIQAAKNKIIEYARSKMGATTGVSSDFAKESTRLAAKYGTDEPFPLTASQITQGPFEKTLAGYAARSPFGIAAFEQHETGAQQAAHGVAERFLQRLHPEQVTQEGLGEQIKAALFKAKGGLENNLNTQMTKDFAFLDRAIGGRPVIPVDNFRAVLMQRGEQLRAPDMPPEAQALGEKLVKEAMAIPEGQVSARAMEERFRRLASKNPLFEGIKGAELETLANIQKEAHGALVKDLEAAASMRQFQGGPPARLLKEARDNLGRNTEAIEALQRDTLSKFGFRPATQGAGVENYAEWFIRAPRQPSEIRNAMQVLEGVDPSLPGKVSRYVMEQAMIAGREGGKGIAAGFDRKEFLKALPEPEALKAMYPRDPRTGQEIAKDVADLSELLHRSLWQGGQRPVLQEAPQKTVASVLGQESKLGMIKTTLERILTPKFVAAFETDPVWRKEVYNMVRRLEQGLPVTKATEGALERIIKKVAPSTIYETSTTLNTRNDPNRAPLEGEEE